MSSVSVVIPTYNRPRQTAAAVSSALQQQPAADEILIVDDGSTPPFLRAQLDIDDPRVRIIRKDRNGGAAAARQTGVDAAGSEWIAFLDSDDIWLPGKLAAQLQLCVDAGDRLVAVACGWRTAPEDGSTALVRIPVSSASIEDFASGCWYSPGSTVLLPKRAFGTVGRFDDTLPRLEDYEWFLRFALAGGTLAVAPVVGAVISTGRRARLAAVAAASRTILDRYAESMALPAAARRRQLAYLALELASAARADGNWLLLLWSLLRSWILNPRTTLQMRRWWSAG